MSILSEPPTPDELRAAALAYAARGRRVLPCHTLDGEVCTCGRPDCTSQGKHPITARGCLDATTAPETIGRWWAEAPLANVGVATGEASGIWILDLDGPAGVAEFNLLADKHGEPPKTFTVETGGGGRHLYFAWPAGRTIGNRAKIGGRSIDARGEGGYVLAPPSWHRAGRRYRLDLDVEPAQAPAWLLDLVAPVEAPGPAPSANGLTLHVGAGGADLPSRIRAYLASTPPAVSGQGGHAATYAVACTLVHGFGLSSAEALPYFSEWNATCKPPWTDKELRHKLDDAQNKGGPPPGRSRGYLLAGRAAPQPAPLVPSLANVGRTPAVAAPARPRLIEIPQWTPFPVDCLPEPLRSVAVEGSAALGCDPAYVALPLLAVAAGAIGNARKIRTKRDWSEPAIVWAAIVGESGTLKSPALRLAVRPLRRLQTSMYEAHKETMEDYSARFAEYERDLAAWRRSKDAGDVPEKPDEPTCRRLIAADTTIEKLAAILGENPNGVLVARDELAEWFQSFNRYKAGSDAASWLKFFHGDDLTVDRKQSGTIHVPRACVSIVGGIQPTILAQNLTQEHRENGLAARILLTMPPRRPKRWTEDELSDESEQQYSALVERLVDLDYAPDGEPRTLGLAFDAKRRWIAHYDQWNTDHQDAEGDLAAAFSKLEGYGARLALIHHVVGMVAAGDVRAADPVGLASVEAAVALTHWFAREAARIYALLGESEAERDLRRLVEMVRRKGGAITARDLMRSSRRYATTEAAQADLASLAAAGLGTLTCDTPAGGGHPVWRFSLAPTLTHADTRPAGDTASDPHPSTIAPTLELTPLEKHGKNERVSTTVNVNGDASRQTTEGTPPSGECQRPETIVDASGAKRRRVRI